MLENLFPTETDIITILDKLYNKTNDGWSGEEIYAKIKPKA